MLDRYRYHPSIFISHFLELKAQSLTISHLVASMHWAVGPKNLRNLQNTQGGRPSVDESSCSPLFNSTFNI